LLGQIDRRVGRVTADSVPNYEMVAVHVDDIDAAIPPRSTAIPCGEVGSPTQRVAHLEMFPDGVDWLGRPHRYGQRALVETARGHYQALI
jgi:hypothetical protein